MIGNRIPSCASGGVYPRRVGRRDRPGGPPAQYSCRAVLGCFLVTGLLVGSLAAADDPVPDQAESPVRLKKKAKPQPEPAPDRRPEAAPKKEQSPKKTEPPPKSGEAKEDPELDVRDLEEQIREIMNRVSKNLARAEERLKTKDPGEVTQQMQRDIVRDLDELIQQAKRQQQQQQQQGGSSSSPQSQRSRQARNNPMQQGQASAKGPVQTRQSQAKDQSGNKPRGGERGQEGMGKLADLYKDIWGHLPETLRPEMDQYSREQFMAKYGDLLKQYYATIAEKGRRKGEP